MTDRNVTVTIPMRASQIELTRNLTAHMIEYPMAMHRALSEVRRLLEEGSESDGIKVAQILAAITVETEQTCAVCQQLCDIAKGAKISDPDHDKEQMQ